MSKDLSESLWRRRQSAEREPELYSAAFPRKVQPEPTRSQRLAAAGFTRRPTWHALPPDDEPISDDERERLSEVAESLDVANRALVEIAEKTEAVRRVLDEPPFHWADGFIALVFVGSIAAMIFGVL